MNDEIKIENWPSILSEKNLLYFENLSSTDKLVITVSDQENHLYEITIDHAIVYQVIDETYLTHYWTLKARGIGPTLLIVNSKWPESFKLLKLNHPDVKHFVLATEDECIEILSETMPIIKRIH
jgi:hypothetical protein